MKKLILPIAAFVLITSAVMAQDSKTPEITLCKKTPATISIAELERCNMILPVDEKTKVTSFTVSYLVEGKDGKAVYVDYKVQGSSFSEQALAQLKNTERKIDKVVIENVTAVDANKNEKKITGMVLTIK